MTSVAAQELESQPRLSGLYTRAVLGAVLPGGKELPERRLALREVRIDRDHLAAYDRVCGFTLSDALPPTYLHVVAFPLSMALMTERSFPFSVLGLVHIANRIEQRRAVLADECPTVTVWAEDLRAHRRGRQFDVVAEAEVGADVVWRERSTYLRRGKGTQEQREGDDESRNGGPRRSGPEPPSEVTARLRVPGDIGRRYAAVSGDRNPIHLHGLTARMFGMGGAIAHGMWMKARCLAAFEDLHAGACAAEVRFASPLRIPADAGLASARRGDGVAFALRARTGDRVHMSGTIEPLR